MSRKLTAVFLSALLLSLGWLGFSGLTLSVAFVPLLWISSSYDDSRRSWWKVFGWALLTFVLWNAATIWWIWNATWVGPFAATLVSTTLNMIAFMLFHTVSKKAPKALAYTILVAAWITTEYWYTTGEFSFPWLILGNGFSESAWAVQWYEYTGVFGGSLWVLVTNILVFEAWRSRKRSAAVKAALVATVPTMVSAAIYFTYKPSERSMRVTVIQPNVDCYDKFHGDIARQERNLLELIAEAPADVRFIAMPETALTNYLYEPSVTAAPIVDSIASLLRAKGSDAIVVSGANTWRRYDDGTQTETARRNEYGYYDLFNSAIAVSSDGEVDIYHKSRLVIGVEKTPLPKLFEWLEFLVIDLGGTVGQLGVGTHPEVFSSGNVKAGPSICYEAIYGDFYGGFVRRGAEAMLVISNDGWWGDTPGYKRLFAFCRLRAIEHRRAIARSANTGISGFISERGDDGQRLGWDRRGILTDEVTLNARLTFYTRYGDYIARISQYLTLLCVLYFIAYRVKRKNYLVK
ncbi:MAG: apolipoprotein N-acyltransferase [Alistipes sp.]|nr:apolipoprotein N-acyltransferase [Alistipes sp.]